MRASRRVGGPGFGVPFEPEINVERKVLCDLHLAACIWKPSATAPGPMSISCSTSTSTPRTKAISKILREIADLDMFWIEVDGRCPEALGYIRRQSQHPIPSCETLLEPARISALFPRRDNGCRDHRHAVERVWQSMKIAAQTQGRFEVNVAPHNFYGHLCTMMNAHFSATVQTCGSWRPTSTAWPGTARLFTHVPDIVDGHLVIPGPARLGHRAQ